MRVWHRAIRVAETMPSGRRKARSCMVVGYFASAPSASSARLKRLSMEIGWFKPARTLVADTADGADGVVGSVLAHGRYPDGPRSQPPLAAEDDLNPKRAKRGLCPAQPASECAGTLWPARPGPSGHSIAANIDADLQKVGCASLNYPARPFLRNKPANGRRSIRPAQLPSGAGLQSPQSGEHHKDLARALLSPMPGKLR